MSVFKTLLLVGCTALSYLAQAQQQPAVIKLEDTIRGDQEQPKVLTIVPWQAASVKHNLPSQIEERINKTFAPLERDEFTRQLQFLIEQQGNNSYSEQSLKP